MINTWINNKNEFSASGLLVINYSTLVCGGKVLLKSSNSDFHLACILSAKVPLG